MNRLKQCLFAGLASCLLALPCVSLAEGSTQPPAADVTMTIKASGESELLQAVQAKDYEKALQIVNAQIEKNPNNANAYDHRSTVYWFLGRSDEALADCDKAISLEPDKAFHYLNRGSIYEQRKEYQMAVNVYTKALGLTKDDNPLEGLMYFNRARAYTQLDDYDKALADIKQGETLAPAFPQNYFLEGLIHEKKGEMKQAKESRKIGVMYELVHRGDYYLAGAVAEEAGLNDQALALLNEAAKRSPDSSDVYSERGLVYANLSRPREAIIDLTKALSLKETAMDYNNRGECYRALKQFDLARKDYDKAVSLAQSNNDKQAVYDSLGQLAMDQGDYRTAANYVTKALEVEPYEDGYRLRAKIWRHLGELKKADQDEAAAQEIEQRQLLGR